MHKIKLKLAASILLVISLVNHSHCQQSNIFNQTPFQRQQLQQQQQNQRLRQLQQQQQQLQRQQPFPGNFNNLNQLNPLAALNTIPPISPIGPQAPFRPYNQLTPPNFVPITAYQNDLNYDGSFSYGYASADGTTAQAQGYVKNLGLGEAVEAQVVEGSYSYTSPEGTPITVRYIADENGFRAEGAHIPTPPPIPDAIAKSLQYISSVQPYQQTLNPNLNPYQTPFRQFPQTQNLRTGQQLTPLQLQQQQQQQQQRFFQQSSGQYQPENEFGAGIAQQAGLLGTSNLAGQLDGQTGILSPTNDLNQTEQRNLQQKQQQQNLQNIQQQQQQQQQQLATQELRERNNQFVSPFGYNQYRRYKKATKT